MGDTDTRPLDVPSLNDVTASLTAPGAMFEMEDVVVRGIAMRAWKNAPLTLRDLLQLSRAHGDAEFLVYDGDAPGAVSGPFDRLSYTEHFRAAARFAHRLVDQASGPAIGSRSRCATSRSGASPAGGRPPPGRWWSRSTRGGRGPSSPTGSPTPAPGSSSAISIAPGGSRTQPLGEVGELWIKGPNVVKGYWNKPDATAAAISDGWLHSGDVARLDDEGFVYIVDRAKDMIIRGGENVYCVEVEMALFEHPAVTDAAAIGIPHHVLGEEVGAVVHLAPGTSASEDELRDYVATRIAAFKVPVRIWFKEDPLPRNPNGKILKRDLKTELLGA